MKEQGIHSIHRVLVLWMLVLYSVGLFRSYAPFVDYALNYNYITKVLCVNKEKAGSCCKGSCHLKNQLKKAGDEGSKPSGYQLNNLLEEYDLGFELEWELPVYSEFSSRTLWLYLPFIPAALSERDSPPPQPLV
ncbi:MAG: hypothetical protein K1X82_07160 [Bacteroidia bacterium]|nr:hypothetical protein [Bacteroidia bacterium]